MAALARRGYELEDLLRLYPDESRVSLAEAIDLEQTLGTLSLAAMWIDVLLVGYFRSQSDTGIYQAAAQVTCWGDQAQLARIGTAFGWIKGTPPGLSRVPELERFLERLAEPAPFHESSANDRVFGKSGNEQFTAIGSIEFAASMW